MPQSGGGAGAGASASCRRKRSARSRTHTQGVTELYFVAFAPDGDGATWRPRIEQAKRVMDERWATEGRSLAYVNDTSLLTQAPMATVTHLRQALEEIGGAIDPDEDVVMITAGRSNPDGSILVSLPLLGLVLSGAGLAHLLTQAGIRWRVVILAKVPQAFHDALADESTLVFAAGGRGERAAGCAGTGEPTAFADALFGEALMQAASLPAAFEAAQRKVAARNPAPVLHVGAAIAEQLKRFAWCRRRSACLGDYTPAPWLLPSKSPDLSIRVGALRVVRGLSCASIPAPSVACSALPDAARRRCCAASPASRRSKAGRSHWAAASCRALIQRAVEECWDGVPGLRAGSASDGRAQRGVRAAEAIGPRCEPPCR